MAAAVDETWNPGLLPLSYEYLGYQSFIELSSSANPSSHHSRTTWTFLSLILDFGPFESTNSKIQATLPHFLTSHINNFRSPILQRPATSSPDVQPFLPSTQYPLMIPKAEPTKVVHTTTPPFSSQTPQLLASALHETRAGKPA